jgi:hypothetical protein
MSNEERNESGNQNHVIDKNSIKVTNYDNILYPFYMEDESY